MPLRRLRPLRLLRDETGAVSVEMLLMFPLLAWAYVGMFVFFDAFREQNANVKASYVVSDILSRESQEIDDDFIAGLGKTLNYIADSREPAHLRVSVVRYDGDAEALKLIWSRSTETDRYPDLTQAEIAGDYADDIPPMPNADHAILVETWAQYSPLADVGIPPFEFANLVVTSPRFQGPLNFVGHYGGRDHDHDDHVD